jgi:hypothetical protein
MSVTPPCAEESFVKIASPAPLSFCLLLCNTRAAIIKDYWHSTIAILRRSRSTGFCTLQTTVFGCSSNSTTDNDAALPLSLSEGIGKKSCKVLQHTVIPDVGPTNQDGQIYTNIFKLFCYVINLYADTLYFEVGATRRNFYLIHKLTTYVISYNVTTGRGRQSDHKPNEQRTDTCCQF